MTSITPSPDSSVPSQVPDTLSPQYLQAMQMVAKMKESADKHGVGFVGGFVSPDGKKFMMTNMNQEDTQFLLPDDLKWQWNQTIQLIVMKRYGNLLQRLLLTHIRWLHLMTNIVQPYSSVFYPKMMKCLNTFIPKWMKMILNRLNKFAPLCMTKKSPINFDRTIAGVNITEHGIKSYTKSFQLGPFQLTLNGSGSGVQGSISLPGTGLSKRHIRIIWNYQNIKII